MRILTLAYLCFLSVLTYSTAIAVLKDKEPGSFIVRDSHSFRGAYGLAMKVATPPPTVLQQSKKGAFKMKQGAVFYLYIYIFIYLCEYSEVWIVCFCSRRHVQ